MGARLLVHPTLLKSNNPERVPRQSVTATTAPIIWKDCVTKCSPKEKKLRKNSRGDSDPIQYTSTRDNDTANRVPHPSPVPSGVYLFSSIFPPFSIVRLSHWCSIHDLSFIKRQGCESEKRRKGSEKTTGKRLIKQYPDNAGPRLPEHARSRLLPIQCTHMSDTPT